MKTFKEYYDLREAYSYEYTVPKDLSKQMADFYILTTIYQTIKLSDNSNTEMDLKFIIDDAINKIVDIQHQTLIKIFISMAILHMLYEADINIIKSSVLNQSTRSKFSKLKSMIDYENDYDKYEENYKKYKSSGLTDFELIKNLNLTTSITQEDAYKNMANAIEKLTNANNLNNKIQSIDFAYSTAHNFTPILDRFPYEGKGNLFNILDTKFEGDIWDIQQYSSLPKSFIGIVQRYITNPKSLESKKGNFIKPDVNRVMDRIVGPQLA